MKLLRGRQLAFSYAYWVDDMAEAREVMLEDFQYAREARVIVATAPRHEWSYLFAYHGAKVHARNGRAMQRTLGMLTPKSVLHKGGKRRRA